MDKHEIIGWVGTFLIFVAYAMLSFGFLLSTNWMYQALNIVGSLGIVYISLWKKVYQPAVLNIVWAAIACVALLQLLV